MTDPEKRKQRRYMNICKNMLGPESRIKEPDIRCIWVLDRLPKKLPDSQYLGMILWPTTQVVIFSITKGNHTFEWEDGVNVKWSWFDPRRQNKEPVNRARKLLMPGKKIGRGNNKKYVARTLSGLDKEFIV